MNDYFEKCLQADRHVVSGKQIMEWVTESLKSKTMLSSVDEVNLKMAIDWIEGAQEYLDSTS